MKRVIIDMNNPNTLVSLAYIKTNKNPLLVFCNYILYLLLTAPNESLRADELKNKLGEKFGLLMPQQMISSCVRILRQNGELVFLPNGGGYAVGNTEFNVCEFENNLRRLQAQEESVLTSMAVFVNDNYRVNWTLDDARKHLSLFLDEEGNGARLFLSNKIEPPSSRVSPSWYVGRYVAYVQQQEDSSEKTYLEEIVNGMMIYEGIYQTNDYQQDKDQKFKGTVFYFDTKLILRALGYSWHAHVQSTQELIQLITKEYGGQIGVFPQTISEVENALVRAGRNYEKGETIANPELRVYAELDPTGASLLLEAATTVQARLTNEFGIAPPPEIDWNSESVKANTIETQQIVDYIQMKHTSWRKGTINYDVEIINQINILRESDYSVRYGSRKKLPVFVTTNTDLVYTFRDYVSQELELNPSSIWRVQALPIVSDNMILFRLWVPVANRYTGLPAITLARYAYSAQNPGTQYFEKLRDCAAAYQTEKGVNLINLSEIRRQQLEDLLIIKTMGDAEALTEEMVATSIDELVKMENISLHQEIKGLKGTIGNQDTELLKRNERIIVLAATPYVNKIGWRRIIVFVSKIWWIITTAILYLVCSYAENYISTNVNISLLAGLAPIVIQLILTVIDKAIDDRDLRHFAIKPAVRYVWKKYSQKVSSKIAETEKIHEQDILNYCLTHTPLFARYQQYCR